MNSNELKVVFKAVQDTSVKKVIDNIKGEVNSIGKATSGIFGKGGGSGSFWKLNPGVKQQLDSAQQAAQAAMRAPTMQNVVRNWQILGRQKPALPNLPPFMQNPNFFKPKEESRLSQAGSLISTQMLAFSGALVAGVAGFQLFKKSVDEFKSATDNARMLYAKSLTTGIGLGQTTRRTLLSNIIGVSETDLMRFGAAMNYLNPKIEWASRRMTETTIPLTELSYKFKILDANLKASAATLLTSFAPAIEGFLDKISSKIKSTTDSVKSSMDKWDAAAEFAKKTGFAVTRDYKRSIAIKPADRIWILIEWRSSSRKGSGGDEETI